MPKPKGTTGSTKMKILAILCHNDECGRESYGYGIWQILKDHFHIYLHENDVRNVYHHLKGLSTLELIEKNEPAPKDDTRCFYCLTERGRILKHKYERYIEILRQGTGMF